MAKKDKIGKHGAHAGADKSADKSKYYHTAPTDDAAQFTSQQTRMMPPMQGGNGYAAPQQINQGYRGTQGTAPAQGDFFAPQQAGAGYVEFGTYPEKKRGKGKKVALILLAIILVALLAVYGAGAYFFSSHFFPGSSIGTSNVSMKSTTEAGEMLDKVGSNYSFTVSGQGANFTVTAAEAGITVDGKKAAGEAVKENNIWAWPYEITRQHDVSAALAAEYNQSGLEQIVQQNIDSINATAQDPVNASIQYDEGTSTFTVKPEEAGTKLDAAKVLEAVDAAAVKMESAVTLDASDLIQPTVLKNDERLTKACSEANGYVKADLKLVLGDEQIDAGTIDGKQISQWVKLGDDFSVTFDEEAMNTWVSDLSYSMDTVGKTRSYTTPYGKEVTVSGGTYGWEIDSESLKTQVIDGIKNGTQATITVPCVTEAAKYKNDGTPDWGAYADVDLSEQHARFYNTAGELVWEADCVTGIPDGKHDTPVGVWTVFIRESPSTLKGEIQQSTGKPEYETEVQYWMQFTYSGCGFHDATWQSAFGGTRYQDGYGSHGCVNLSYSNAEALYDIISVGNAVVVHE